MEVKKTNDPDLCCGKAQPKAGSVPEGWKDVPGEYEKRYKDVHVCNWVGGKDAPTVKVPWIPVRPNEPDGCEFVPAAMEFHKF